MDFEFGYGGASNGNNPSTQNGNGNEPKTNIDTNGVTHTEGGDDTTDLNNPSSTGDKDKNNEPPKNNTNNDPNKDTNSNNNNNNDNTDLTPGTSIEFDNNTYTVAENGDILDKDGNVFKEAKDVKDWLASLEVNDNNDKKEIDIKSIQESLGINITDENDKPIEYDNTPDGIASYIKDAIEVSRDEHYQTAIDTLFNKYPILNDVLNYYRANGNSLEGFGEMKDRSNITINADDKEQQKLIIKTAWAEQGKKGNVDAYIEYLESSGTLQAVAEEELQGLKDSDAEYRESIAKQAKAAEEQAQQEAQEYWAGVHKLINERKIAGYEIPENIIINRNGQKISATPNDFFNYIYQIDAEGKTRYAHDLEQESPESRRDDEILRAYLKFVGGNYSNLVDMAINEEKVRKLRLSAKQNQKPKVTITKPTPANKDNALDLGY